MVLDWKPDAQILVETLWGRLGRIWAKAGDSIGTFGVMGQDSREKITFFSIQRRPFVKVSVKLKPLKPLFSQFKEQVLFNIKME
jgi:hypothetical protein